MMRGTHLPVGTGAWSPAQLMCTRVEVIETRVGCGNLRIASIERSLHGKKSWIEKTAEP